METARPFPKFGIVKRGGSVFIFLVFFIYIYIYIYSEIVNVFIQIKVERYRPNKYNTRTPYSVLFSR